MDHFLNLFKPNYTVQIRIQFIPYPFYDGILNGTIITAMEQ